MAIKNFWSLNVDEAIVVDRIKEELGKNYEVFFPGNPRLKDIDLVVFDLKNGNAKTVQVKGSRSYLWDINEQRSWHIVPKDSIFKPKNKVDFFIFIWHVVYETKKERSVKQAYLVIPINDFKRKLKAKPMRHNKTYHFAFWTDFKNKVDDARNPQSAKIDFSEFLDRFDLLIK